MTRPPAPPTRAVPAPSATRRRALAAAAAALAPLRAARAQAWPSKPIRLVVVYPTGGVSDSVARLLAPRLAERLGTQVIVENRGGAGGSIGMDAVAKAPADGHALAFSAVSPVTLNPHVMKLPYDPLADLTPVASVMYSPVYLLGTPAFTGRSFADAIAQSRAKPGALRLATSGIASVGHLMVEQIRATAKVDIVHVPYKGGGQQMNDALSGQFEVLSTNASGAVMQHIQAGKLRPLAVGAPTRLDTLAAVPTLAELGFAAANLSSVFGVFAPAGTPAPVLQRLNAEINRALTQPDLRARLTASDNLPTGGRAADFARQIATESEHNARIIKAANIRAE